MPDDETRIPREGDPIPPVDPDDLRRSWKDRPTWTCGASREAQINLWAVTRRDGMIRMLAHFSGGQLLAPWQHGTELDDAVFRIAATFPMRTVHHRVYMVEGDEMFGFDPNAFVQRLIEETGVPHIWEPISTRIHERGLLFRFTRVARRDEARSEPTLVVDEREARLQTREVFWDCWDKYHHLQPSKLGAEMYAQSVAWRFADFVFDNIDLAQQLIADFSGKGGGVPDSFAIVTELERRTKDFARIYGVPRVRKEDGDKPCPNCKRLYKDHSDDEMRTCFNRLMVRERNDPNRQGVGTRSGEFDNLAISSMSVKTPTG